MDMAEAGTEPLAQRADKPLIPQSTVWLMAITVGVIVANIYYIQPLLADIAHTFGLSVTRAGTIAMLSQAGTALGMFLFVPLGDKYERRSLILLLVLGAFVSLSLMGTAPNACWLGCAAFAVGAFAANVHVVVPFAANLAAPQQRGRVVGTVVAGILFGVLLARTFSGSIGALLGWRAVYGIAAGALKIVPRLTMIMQDSVPGRASTTGCKWNKRLSTGHHPPRWVFRSIYTHWWLLYG
jgi:predicted MFS family arabinose efflux permease